MKSFLLFSLMMIAGANATAAPGIAGGLIACHGGPFGVQEYPDLEYGPTESGFKVSYYIERGDWKVIASKHADGNYSDYQITLIKKYQGAEIKASGGGIITRLSLPGEVVECLWAE